MRTRRARLLAIISLCGLLGLLTAVPASATFPGADGLVAFSHETGILVARLTPAGYSERVLATGRALGHPRFSADGSHVVFSDSRDGSISVVDASGSNRHVVVAPADLAEAASQPSWSPAGIEGGQRIVFVATWRWGERRGRSEMFTVRPDGSDLRRISYTSPRSCGVAEPSWSPDGTHLSYLRLRGPSPDCDVYGGTDGASLMIRDLVTNYRHLIPNYQDDGAPGAGALFTADGKALVMISEWQCGRDGLRYVLATHRYVPVSGNSTCSARSGNATALGQLVPTPSGGFAITTVIYDRNDGDAPVTTCLQVGTASKCLFDDHHWYQIDVQPVPAAGDPST